MEEFRRLKRLPAYVFNITGEMKASARRRGEDIIDFGMGNPDGATPKHIVDKLIEAAQEDPHCTATLALPRPAPPAQVHLRLVQAPLQRRSRPRNRSHRHYRLQGGHSPPLHRHARQRRHRRRPQSQLPHPHLRPRHRRLQNPEHRARRHQPGAPRRLRPSSSRKHRARTPAHEPAPQAPHPQLPANPTTQCVDLSFFERLVPLCKELGIYIVHDLAYADLVFDGYRAPSILEVPGAKDIAVEFFTLSKSYNMPGWRVGFMVGNKNLVAALGRIKSYFDYGTFTPIQVASIAALEGPQDCVTEIVANYKSRRDVLVHGMNKLGWQVELPKATMFVWAKIPEQFRALGSIEFSKKLLIDAKTAVSPGIGFGERGDNYVRFALIENEERTRQALRGIKQMFKVGRAECRSTLRAVILSAAKISWIGFCRCLFSPASRAKTKRHSGPRTCSPESPYLFPPADLRIVILSRVWRISVKRSLEGPRRRWAPHKRFTPFGQQGPAHRTNTTAPATILQHSSSPSCQPRRQPIGASHEGPMLILRGRPKEHSK